MDLEKIDIKVNRASMFVIIVAAVLPIIYMIWFLANNHTLSTDTSDWGAFGDYIGGLLNPLVAFFAFYWLTQSIRIQKEELTYTRETLVETLEQQKHQSETTLKSVLLQNLNIQLDAINSAISLEKAYIMSLTQQAQFNGAHYSVITEKGENIKISDILPTLNKSVQEKQFEKQDLILKVKKILDDMHTD